MSRRTEVTEALVRILEDEIKEVAWFKRTVGAVRGKVMHGTVSCDKISYEWDTKGDRTATATYSIFITDDSSVDGVDVIADRIDEVLTANPSLDNWATDSVISEIVYGAAQGKTTVGVALITLKVDYDC